MLRELAEAGCWIDRKGRPARFFSSPLDGASASAVSMIGRAFGKPMLVKILLEIGEHSSQVCRRNGLDQMQVEARLP